MTLTHPWLLWLLPLALLPLLPRARAGAAPLDYSWLAMLPRDALSGAIDWLLRIAGALSIAALIVALAGPYLPEAKVELVGQGAQIVLLLDRSRSMDQPFVARHDDSSSQSKASVAQQLLAQFAAQRRQDLFGMVAFSALPIRVVDFTQKQDVIQAAIRASVIGKGLSDTDIGRGLLAALQFFEGRPYGGSRIVMLVSDGGARIDQDVRERIVKIIKRERVGLYWIYLRSFRSPGLLADSAAAPQYADTVPEHFLHRFFQSIGTPYRAYEAEDPDALKRAIDDVGRLESLPIRLHETLPRREFTRLGYALALALVALLLTANALEVRRWA